MRLTYVLRRLIHSPGFTLITALTLALGIGANSAIFSVIEGILLKPLPYPRADRLVAINHTAPGINFTEAGSAPFLYFTYREEGRVFEKSGLWQSNASSITGLAEPEQVPSINVTVDVLPALGISPSIGRWFSPKDDSPGAPETAILMNGYWRARFGGEPNVIGRRIIVDGRATEIIGVMPDSFRFLTRRASLILPLQIDREKTRLGNFSYRGIGRLKPGATLQEASVDVARMIPMGLERFPAFPGFDKTTFNNARLGQSQAAQR
jgi:putative ABC transport system permease protein